jgi:hypothetical protein
MTKLCNKGWDLKFSLNYCLDAQIYFVYSDPPWRTRIQNCQRTFDKHIKKCKQCKGAINELESPGKDTENTPDL